MEETQPPVGDPVLLKPELTLFRESPAIEHDDLQFRSIAVDLSRLLREAPKPFVYALCGRWGCGKSTLIAKTILEIRSVDQSCSLVPIYFNAWEAASTDDIIAAFISALGCHLPEYVSDVDQSNRKRILQGITAGIRLTSETGIVGKILHGVYLASRKKQRLEEVSEVKLTAFRELDKWMAGLCRKLHENEVQVVVFIDELDRCPPQAAVRMIESLRLFFSGENRVARLTGVHNDERVEPPIAYVLAIDEAAIVSAFGAEYKLDFPAAHRYLDKFVNFKFHFPSPDFEGLVERCLEGYAGRENPLTATLGTQAEFIGLHLSAYATMTPREALRILHHVLVWTDKIWISVPEVRKELGSEFQSGARPSTHGQRLACLLNSYMLTFSVIKVRHPEYSDWAVQSEEIVEAPLKDRDATREESKEKLIRGPVYSNITPVEDLHAQLERFRLFRRAYYGKGMEPDYWKKVSNLLGHVFRQ